MMLKKIGRLRPSVILRYFRNARSRYFKIALPKRDFYSGLIGCGHIVRVLYVPALNRADNPVILSGLHSKSQESAENIKKLLRYQPEIFHSYDDLLRSGIKSVIIATPNQCHKEHIIESLKMGCDVLCEKPIANSMEDVFKIKTALKNSNNILMVGFNRRYVNKTKQIKLLINGGEIGPVIKAHAFYNQNISGHLMNSSWLSDVNKSGGGIIHHAGVHSVNLLLYFFGKIDRVFADFHNVRLPSSVGEDTALCSFTFSSGVVGTLTASYVNMAASDYDFIIEGEKGTIKSCMHKNNIIIKRQDSSHSQTIRCYSESNFDSVFNELIHFYDCVKYRKNPETDIEDSIETLKATNAARISAVEKREVYIEEIVV